MSEQRRYAEFPSHTVSYEIMTNADDEDKERSFTVLATRQEIEQLAEQGYLIREALFQGEQLERLRSALDEVETAEVAADPRLDGERDRTVFGCQPFEAVRRLVSHAI